MPANDEFCFRYTDLSYVTKQGFFSALGTSLVESLWDKVVNYRLKYSSRAKLRNVSQLPFTLTETVKLKERYAQFAALLSSAKEEYAKFAALPEEGERAKRAAYFESLRLAAEIEGQHLSEPVLRAMAAGLSRDDQSHQTLSGYRDFLKGSVGAGTRDCNAFFVALYSAFLGSSELTTFYRVTDSTVGQGRAGDYAKYNDIDSLLANLEEFVATDPLFGLAKAFLAGYFVQYVEFFVEHNALAGAALTKRLLSLGELGEFALLLPLEAAFQKTPKSKAAFDETAKTADFTYVFLYYIDVLTPAIEAMLSEWTKIRNDAFKREVRAIPQEERMLSSRPELTEVQPEAKVEIQEVEPAPAPELTEIAPTAERVAEVVPTPAPSPSPSPAKKEAEPREEPKKEEVPVLQSLPAVEPAAFAPRASLSDKEVKMFARYIVETHPDISKQQALFYASHSTQGRYYTIQDYKRTMKVAYETARTSMDRLAQALLYRKLRIKNKYVYTPRSPGEKE